MICKTKCRAIILLIFVMLISTAACRAAESGRQEKQSETACRIVSLAPSNTELLFSLDCSKMLIAVSESCDFPRQAKEKAVAGSLSSVKLEKLAVLKPDLILLVSGQEHLQHKLSSHGFKTLLLDNSSAKSIASNLRKLGAICRKEKEAAALANSFEQGISSLEKICSKARVKPRVFICVWPQPLMSAGKGSFLSEGVTISGGINCTRDEAQPYPRINPERLLLLKADYILLPQEQAKDKFWLQKPWTYLEAVKKGQILVMPQEETDCLNRPTLRFIKGLHWLALKLHPELAQEINNWYRKSAAALSEKEVLKPTKT